MKNIIVILGPTAVGKTKLSVLLAKKYDAEIINCDSMQVYKGLNIATAKIKEEEKEGVMHHLFDIVDINTNYTVFDYQRDCRKKIDELLKKKKKVILVGGTGLYVKAALFNYIFTENKEEDNLYLEYTNEEILEKIKEYDSNASVHVNNRKRLVRLLNKYEKKEEITHNKDELLYDATFIGLTTERNILYDRINKRVDQMMEDGLLDEVEKYKKSLETSKALMTGIGYKEFVPFYKNKFSLDETLENIKKNSRNYAKRQYTFFNNQFHDLKWFDTNFSNFTKTFLEVCNYLDKN